MFKLRIIQGLNGDCLIVEHGSQDNRYTMLIDGGPGTVYKKYLKEELVGIRDKGGKINLAVLSHVDDDHVHGLLDLLHELIEDRRKGKQETIAILGLWHNSFGKTLGEAVERGMTRQMDSSMHQKGVMPNADSLSRNIKQGDDLIACARGLKIPINFDFRETPGRLVCVDNINKPIQQDNLKIRVIGPTRGELQSLQKEWEAWLVKRDKAAKLPAAKAEAATRELDRSVPNLSSIMLLVEAEGKTVLLSGDGLGEHLLEGLHQSGLIKEDGTFHVDVFKLPHHGSARNVTPELFDRITADTYVISANGTNENPEFQTLEWLVQAAAKQGRSFSILATNETKSIKTLVAQYDPEKNHYKLKFIEPESHSITLDLCEPTA
jgi:beta-lactamase superfamily II metal-dependent hydrolase